VDGARREFYDALLAVLREPVLRDGAWRLLECAPAWDGNWTWDCYLAWTWQGGDGRQRLVAINYAGNQSQCYVRLPLPELDGRTVRLRDLMGPSAFDRDGSDLASRGLYLDLPPWGFHVFEVTAS
jgi:hypothetical protein